MRITESMKAEGWYKGTDGNWHAPDTKKVKLQESTQQTISGMSGMSGMEKFSLKQRELKAWMAMGLTEVEARHASGIEARFLTQEAKR